MDSRVRGNDAVSEVLLGSVRRHPVISVAEHPMLVELLPLFRRIPYRRPRVCGDPCWKNSRGSCLQIFWSLDRENMHGGQSTPKRSLAQRLTLCVGIPDGLPVCEALCQARGARMVCV